MGGKSSAQKPPDSGKSVNRSVVFSTDYAGSSSTRTEPALIMGGKTSTQKPPDSGKSINRLVYRPITDCAGSNSTKTEPALIPFSEVSEFAYGKPEFLRQQEMLLEHYKQNVPERQSRQKLLEQHQKKFVVEEKHKQNLTEEWQQRKVEYRQQTNLEQHQQKLQNEEHQQKVLEEKYKSKLLEEQNQRKLVEQQYRQKLLDEQHKRLLLDEQYRKQQHEQKLLEEQNQRKLVEHQQKLLEEQHKRLLLEEQYRKQQHEQKLLKEQHEKKLLEKQQEQERLEQLKHSKEQKQEVLLKEQGPDIFSDELQEKIPREWHKKRCMKEIERLYNLAEAQVKSHAPVKSTQLSNVVQRDRLATNWSSMPANKTFMRIVVQEDTDEFRTTKKCFKATTQKRFDIVQIERVQNPFMLGCYILKKLEMENMFGADNVVEKIVFRGVYTSNIDKICENNFDWRYYGEHHNSNWYGRGVSFSPISYYASWQSHKNDNVKVMFLVRILASKITEGNKHMHIPPLIETHEGNTMRFDTTQRADGKIIVKYSDNDFYPEYVIYYTVGPEPAKK